MFRPNQQNQQYQIDPSIFLLGLSGKGHLRQGQASHGGPQMAFQEILGGTAQPREECPLNRIDQGADRASLFQLNQVVAPIQTQAGQDQKQRLVKTPVMVPGMIPAPIPVPVSNSVSIPGPVPAPALHFNYATLSQRIDRRINRILYTHASPGPGLGADQDDCQQIQEEERPSSVSFGRDYSYVNPQDEPFDFEKESLRSQSSEKQLAPSRQIIQDGESQARFADSQPINQSVKLNQPGPQKITNDISQDSSDISANPKKKQVGRKREKWDVYVNTSKQKIRFFENKLKTAKEDNVSARQRQKMRNIVSASRSRLKGKFHVQFLYNLIRNKNEGMQQLMEIIVDNLAEKPRTMDKIRQDIAKLELAPARCPLDDIFVKPEADAAKDEKPLPTCMQKLPNGKFKTSPDKVADFRDVFTYKFITKDEELNHYQQNDEKDDHNDDDEQ